MKLQDNNTAKHFRMIQVSKFEYKSGEIKAGLFQIILKRFRLHCVFQSMNCQRREVRNYFHHLIEQLWKGFKYGNHLIKAAWKPGKLYKMFKECSIGIIINSVNSLMMNWKESVVCCLTHWFEESEFKFYMTFAFKISSSESLISIDPFLKFTVKRICLWLMTLPSRSHSPFNTYAAKSPVSLLLRRFTLKQFATTDDRERLHQTWWK